MDEIQQVAGTITDTLQTIGREFSSLRLLIQLSLIVFAAVIGTLAASLIRRRIDLNALMLGWPPFLQTAARLLLANLGTIIFILAVAVMRAAMISLTLSSRSYLLGVAAALATAWVVIALVAGLIRNQFVYRLVAVSAWTIAALSILGLLAPTMAALDSIAIVIGVPSRTIVVPRARAASTARIGSSSIERTARSPEISVARSSVAAPRTTSVAIGSGP